MPQLDRIIIFSQVFWFFIFFIFFYILITHFFLPIFLINLKSRKKITEVNNIKIFEFSNNLTNEKFELLKNLNKDLEKLKLSIYFNISCVNNIFLDKKFFNPLVLDKKFILAIKEILFYCNSSFLKNKFFYPKNLNFKIDKKI